MNKDQMLHMQDAACRNLPWWLWWFLTHDTELALTGTSVVPPQAV